MLASGVSIRNTMRHTRIHGCPSIEIKDERKHRHVHPRTLRRDKIRTDWLKTLASKTQSTNNPVNGDRRPM